MAGQKAAEKPKSARNHPSLSSPVKKRSGKILSRGLGGHEIFLEGRPRRRGPIGDKGQVEVVDDPVQEVVRAMNSR